MNKKSIFVKSFNGFFFIVRIMSDQLITNNKSAWLRSRALSGKIHRICKAIFSKKKSALVLT